MRTQTNSQISRKSPKTYPKILENHIRLQAKLLHNFPCTRITLRARKPLRVMWIYWLGATRLSRRGSPRQGRRNQKILKFHVSNPKISSFSSFTKMSKFHENLDFRFSTPGRGASHHFWIGYIKIEYLLILAALPGAPAPGKARRPQRQGGKRFIERYSSLIYSTAPLPAIHSLSKRT